jgi:uncharacterized protein (DUF362 family)
VVTSNTTRIDEERIMSHGMESRACSRRAFLRYGLAGATGLAALQAGRRWTGAAEAGVPGDLLAVPDRSARAPATPVAISRCRSYDHAVLKKSLEETLDLVGGIGSLVRGKSVTVKMNLTGFGWQKMCGLPSGRTYQIHPNLVEVLCGVLSRAGAKRIILAESYYQRQKPESILSRQGWKIDRIRSAGGGAVIFADTRNRGEFKSYGLCKVTYGGYVFPAFQLNRHYTDTDVLISLGKLKNHVAAGITVTVKNLFGISPTSLYGNDAPNERTTSNRGSILHTGSRPVPDGVPGERYTDTPRLGYYRVPRVTADLLGARPVDLAIVDGVETVFGSEGPWCPPPHRPVKPGVIIAGRNAVTTDAVSVGVMGYDPRAGYGEKPFPGENHLNLLARAGIGSNDLSRIEVLGLGLKDALHEFEPPGQKPGWVRKNLLKG